jgi:hypothetical protein
MEWNVTTASLPPGFSARSAALRAATSWPSSSFTAMRSAWKVRVAGWLCPGFLRGRQPSTMRRQVQGGLDGRLGALGHDGAGDAARGAFFAVEMDDIGQQRLGRVGHQIGGARPRPAPCACREGPSRRKEKPRSARSSCMEDTPRSSVTPSSAGCPAVAACSSSSENVPGTRISRSPHVAAQSCGQFERQRIPVDPDHDIRPRFKQSTGVATSAEGAIEPHARNRADRPKDRPQKDRQMGRRGALPRSLLHRHLRDPAGACWPARWD